MKMPPPSFAQAKNLPLSELLYDLTSSKFVFLFFITDVCLCCDQNLNCCMQIFANFPENCKENIQSKAPSIVCIQASIYTNCTSPKQNLTNWLFFPKCRVLHNTMRTVEKTSIPRQQHCLLNLVTSEKTISSIKL